MSFFDKLRFWKKDDVQGPDLGLQGMEPGLGQGPNLGMDLGESGFGDVDKPMYGYPAQQAPLQGYPSPPRQQSQQQGYAQQGFQQQEYEPPVVRTFDHTKAPFQYPAQQQDVSPQQYVADKNYEVISSKLDAVRAALESINQRLANLERMTQDQRRRGGW